jgi:hypothetical protein
VDKGLRIDGGVDLLACLIQTEEHNSRAIGGRVCVPIEREGANFKSTRHSIAIDVGNMSTNLKDGNLEPFDRGSFNGKKPADILGITISFNLKKAGLSKAFISGCVVGMGV